jgi:hypothetical protein
MTNKSSWLSSSIVLLSAFCGLGALFLFLYFQAALGQEKDTPDLVKAALTIELTSADMAWVSANQQRVLVRSSSSALKTYLEDKGWTFADQMGGYIVYKKGDQTLNPNCEMYSGRYSLCDLSRIP